MAKDATMALRVAARFHKASDPANVPDRSMRAILVNMRHSFGKPKLADIHKALHWLGGWTIQPIVGLVNLAGRSDRHMEVDARTMAQGEKLHADTLKRQVAHLPSSPQAGVTYITNVSPEVKETMYGFSFSYEAHKGAEGWKYVAPNGKEFELLPQSDDNPRQFTRDRIAERNVLQLLKWMREETDMVARASEAIENKSTVNRSRDNTGTCPVCFANIKLKEKSGEPAPVMVLHGYKRPGDGQISGNCYGMDYPPYELSRKGTEDHLTRVQKWVHDAENRIKNLKSSYAHREEFLQPSWVGKPVLRKPEDPQYDAAFSDHIRNAEMQLSGLRDSEKFYERMVAKWHPHPLPSSGASSPDFTRS